MFGNYKLIEFLEDGSTRLYNLQSDFSETHDLSEEQPEIREQLLLLLHGWQRDVNALFPAVIRSGLTGNGKQEDFPYGISGN